MPDPPSSPEFSNSPLKRLSGPTRNGPSNARVRSLKPYSRPSSIVSANAAGDQASTTSDASRNGMTRSDSESSLLFGGLKSVFKWFAGGSTAASPSKTDAAANGASATTPKRDRDATDGSPEKKRLKRSTVSGGDVFKKPASTQSSSLYTSNASGGYLDPPTYASSKPGGLTRSSTERGSLNARLAIAPAGGSGLGGMKRSGTLLDLSSGRLGQPSSPRRASPAPSSAWSPWKQQREEQERRLRSGSSRAGSALMVSPARQLRSQSRMEEDDRPLGLPNTSPFAISRSRSTVTVNARSPSRGGSMLRGTPLRNSSMQPMDADVDEHEQQDDDDMMLGRRRTPSRTPGPGPAPTRASLARMSVDRLSRASTLGKSPSMSYLQNPQPVESVEEFEEVHRNEAEKILVTLANMRAPPAGPSSPALPTSFSSRALRRKVQVPAPVPRSFSTANLAPTLPLKLKREGAEAGVTSPMISPYARRKPKAASPEVESKDEASTKASSPALPDPASFPEPPASKLSKPLPVQFSPSAKKVVSTGRATSTLRARSAYTARKHQGAASTAKAGSRFSAKADDDEDDANESDSAAPTPKATPPPSLPPANDIFSQKPSSEPSKASAQATAPAIRGSLLSATQDTYRPRASSPLSKTALTASPDKVDSPPAADSSIVPKLPSFQFSPSASNAGPARSTGAPSFTFQPASGSASPAPAETKASTPSFSFGAKSSEATEPEASESGASSSNPLLSRLGPAPAAPVAPPAKPFSFGTSASQPASTPAPAASSSATPAAAFSFGSATKASAANGDASSSSSSKPAPSFSFAPATPPTSNGASTASSSQTAKPALFSFGAPASTTADTNKTTTAAAAPAPFSFGAPPTTSGSSASEKQEGSSATPFSFGAPASKNSAPAPFAFGAPSAEKKESAPAPFSFGAPAAAAAANEKQKTSSSPAPFTFGAPSATSTVEKKSSTAAPTPFSFGAPSSTAKSAAPATSSSTPSFAFGATSAANGSDSRPASPFGAPSAAAAAAASPFGVSTPTANKPAAAAAPFSFGSTSVNGSTTPTTVGGFGAASNPFGQPPSSGPPTPGGSNAPFVFGSGGGGGGGSTTPVGTPGVASASSPFTFGAPSTTTTTSSPFQFGAPSQPSPAATTAATSGGFNFGATSSGFGAAPLSGGGSGFPQQSQPMAPSLSFGSNAPNTNHDVRQSATPPPQGAPGAPMFALGAGNPIPGSPGSASGRQVRGLPTRRARRA